MSAFDALHILRYLENRSERYDFRAERSTAGEISRDGAPFGRRCDGNLNGPCRRGSAALELNKKSGLRRTFNHGP
jgi:hypothetical protein